MKIQLSQIKASPNPIRKTWDEEGMNNLKWSLMEQGQVEPVGVHKNHDGYVLVWGHRRTEAARRAGWNEIEAVVVPENEVDNLIQAGIENLAGEDMTVKEKAEWAFRLTEMGLSQMEISRRSSVPHNTISKWLTYKRETESGVVPGDKTRSTDEGFKKIINIASILDNDTQAKNTVLQKASNENLNRDLVEYLEYVEKHIKNIESHVQIITVNGEDVPVKFTTKSTNIGS